MLAETGRQWSNVFESLIDFIDITKILLIDFRVSSQGNG